MKELPEFSKGRVLVVGDVMLDRYWHGDTRRISPEAPVPVVQVGSEEARPGGAANVALNVAVLGGSVTLMGLIGGDEAADIVQDLLDEAQVTTDLHRESAYPTISKLRIISRHQQLIRLDFEDGFPGYEGDQLTAGFTEALAGHNVVVLSDYGKGTLRCISSLIKSAREKQVPVLVDPKGTDFEPYRGATLITPNLSEFEAVVGPCESDEEIEQKGLQLMDDIELDALLVTRGEQGMTLLCRNKDPRHMPTHALDVFDVTGAGDTVISTLASGMAAGLNIESATQLANMAAGIVVGKLGTATVSPVELEHALTEQRPITHGVMDEEQLMGAITSAKAKGESIVMTNGCFDILHAGHVTYLEEASRLGDRLVVAVNVDETVRQLKGADRPVNPVDNRMKVLAALGCVDWVVPFSEETPERLICRVKPDYLVKGGDNDPQKIPGNQCVWEAGGDVVVLTYVDGVSTTQIVQSIREKD